MNDTGNNVLSQKKLQGHQSIEATESNSAHRVKELWIDGPSNSRKFIAGLIRPHKSIVQQPHLVGLQSFHSTLLTKAQLVRHWIADQNRRNGPENLHSVFSEHQNPLLRTQYSQHLLHNQQVNASLLHLRCQQANFDTKLFPSSLFGLENHFSSKESENSGFQYDIVEVTEPLVPIATRDIAVQVRVLYGIWYPSDSSHELKHATRHM